MNTLFQDVSPDPQIAWLGCHYSESYHSTKWLVVRPSVWWQRAPTWISLWSVIWRSSGKGRPLLIVLVFLEYWRRGIVFDLMALSFCLRKLRVLSILEASHIQRRGKGREKNECTYARLSAYHTALLMYSRELNPRIWVITLSCNFVLFIVFWVFPH